ncbi:MAG: ATP-binding protein [Spirochaetia bacterium]|nr:ATP-binding protein [Spirochaetia bacterium]
MNNSLFTRLYTTLLVFILTIFFVNYYFTLKTYREHRTFIEKEKLTKIIQSIEPVLNNNYTNLKYLNKYINDTAKNLNVHLTILDTSGLILVSSEKSIRTFKNLFLEKDIVEANVNGFGHTIYQSTEVKQQMLFVTLKEAGDFHGFVRASVVLSDMNLFLNVYKKNIFFVALILLFLSLSGSYFLTRTVTKPLEKLAHATNQIAGGNFDINIPETGSGEISELADNFRIMSKKIKNLFQDISHQKEELTNIIEAIHEKLMVIDSRGIILSANKGFDEILNSGELTGRSYKKLIPNKQIINIIDQTIKNQTGIMEEVILDDKVYLCSSAFMSDIKESVLVMRDISDLKNLENIKRNLIANVSHELRTPLTAIKGFLETLKDDLKGQNKKYLEIIERHTDRLIYIVQDLLILSRLEDQTILPQYQKLKLKDIINDTFLLLEKKANQKGLPLVIEDVNNVNIDGDRNQLVQLFINLIDNAIKYTEKGEIRVILNEKNESVVIDIKDTGIGIDKKHLSRLFERFYVVDNSRSRSQGGTGLGLSIVKHVVNNHKGKVEIFSATEEGTKVRVMLPKYQNKII